jgi:hypothetical protein
VPPLAASNSAARLLTPSRAGVPALFLAPSDSPRTGLPLVTEVPRLVVRRPGVGIAAAGFE